MSTLNDLNIEEWIFDYHEGNLSENQKEKLLAYIEANPQFQEDFHLWEQAKISADVPEEIDYEIYIQKDKPGFRTFAIIGGIAVILVGIFCFIYLPEKQQKAINIDKNEINRTIPKMSSPGLQYPKQEKIVKAEKKATEAQQVKTEKTPVSKSLPLPQNNQLSPKVETHEPTIIKTSEQELIPNTQNKNPVEKQEIQKTNSKLQETPIVIQKDSLVEENIQKSNLKPKKGIRIKLKNTPIYD